MRRVSVSQLRINGYSSQLIVDISSEIRGRWLEAMGPKRREE